MQNHCQSVQNKVSIIQNQMERVVNHKKNSG